MKRNHRTWGRIWFLLALMLGAAHGAVSAQTHAQAEPHSLSPDAAQRKLVDGNKRFVRHRMLHPDQSAARRVDLAEHGQRPFAVVVGCADSRVPPEILFDEGLGDLFVLRVAGNIVDDAVTGSIEYAVEHLGARLVVVLGHQACGAVGAAVHNQRAAHLAALVDAIQPAVDAVKADPASASLADAALVDRVVHANVDHIVGQLQASQPVLAELVRAGKVKVVGGYYDLKKGAVTFTR